jgi:Leucine-rich repeat (LRR) protein
LEKLEKLLQNYYLEEHDNKIILKVEEPICINYVLNKQTNSTGEQSGLILSKLKQLEKENKILKEKLEDTELVYLDNYMIPISKGIIKLYICHTFLSNPAQYTFIDLSPLEVCKKLTKLVLNCSSYVNTYDITPLKNLVELTVQNSSNINSFLGFENCKKLTYLKFMYCNVVDIQKSIFENCTNLKELYITHCPDVMDFSKLQYTLERLTIQDYKGVPINIENCKLLKYLYINSNHEYTCKLDNLTKLEEITMLGLMVITSLQKCVNLRKIKFAFSKSAQLQDKNMAGFKFLETIELASSLDLINIRYGVQKIGF